jgi:oligosaccharyltransferase complex subunit epsilon
MKMEERGYVRLAARHANAIFSEKMKKSTKPIKQAGVWDAYSLNTLHRVKLMDAYMIFILLTGIAQFVYAMVVGTFPFNAFLAGFIASVGSFVFTASLRIQMKGDREESAFADFVVCHILLFLAVANFIG